METGDYAASLEDQSTACAASSLTRELPELESAANSLNQAGLAERAATLRELVAKLLALRRSLDEQTFGDELEALMQAEGSAMRPGPRSQIKQGLLSLFRDAIRANRKVEFTYHARTSGRRSHQVVEPYGVLYGNRAYLVGRADWARSAALEVWRCEQGSNRRRDVRARPSRSQEIASALRAFRNRPRCRMSSARRGAGSPRDFLFHPANTAETRMAHERPIHAGD